MKKSEVFHAWANILAGSAPSLSIEITKECPLSCPGCYAFDPAHLGGATQLRQLSDFKGDELVQRVLAVLDELRPLHVSFVGGDPLVRYRELELLFPEIERRGVHTQVVTSAFRVVPAAWKEFKKLNVVVSIDGLQPEHDQRRKPATYERILKNIAGARVTVHCTITAQIADRPGYLDEFLHFWSSRPEIAKVWFSLFTPQIGATDPEILTAAQRASTIAELRRLRVKYPVLDMPDSLIQEMASPPGSPAECIFARTTKVISADLTTQITPCQFGGAPDCAQCGCIASMGLAAVGHHKVLGPLTAGQIFLASDRFGKGWRKLQNALLPKPVRAAEPALFEILSRERANGSLPRNRKEPTLVAIECRTEVELRRDLVRFSRMLYRLGFMPGTSGNLSVRLDDQRLLVTPTGISKFTMRPADLVVVDLQGKQLGGHRKVTSEVSMHLAVYRHRDDVTAVIHSHPPIATAFACAGRGLEEILCQEAVMTLGVVPLATYATTGTAEVAASLAPFIPDHDAILLANHGAVSYGGTLLQAFQKMETLEHLAQIALVAHQLGAPQILKHEQVQQLRDAKIRYLQNAISSEVPGNGAFPRFIQPEGH